MIYAKDEKNNIVEANMAKKGRKYYCSGCHGQVILRCGKLRVSHFAHKKHACDIFSEGETSEHLRGKKLLMSNCHMVEVWVMSCTPVKWSTSYC